MQPRSGKREPSAAVLSEAKDLLRAKREPSAAVLSEAKDLPYHEFKRKRPSRFLSTAFINAGNDLEALRRRERAFCARGSLLPKS